MKNIVFIVSAVMLIFQMCYAPPVSQNKKDESEESQVNGLEDYMEYHRYLKEVVNALESDPQFREKLEKADENEIKSGKIAEELQFVSHNVRTRLDEIKRIELERLKDLVEKKMKLEDGNSIDDDPMHHHLDHGNPHTFEIEDLKKLIAKTTADLAEADRKRKDEFKHYELEKEYKMQEKLNHTNGAEREKLEKSMKEMAEKHKKHEKLHEPGHKAQLEEVWEEQDQMQQDFDPKTFFMLHDIDGNGLWDQVEVKSLFVKELDKMYQQGAPEDDMRERYEEMERMRESVFSEMDTNNDGFIDYNEFLRQTNSNDFKQDHGWQALDEQRPFTDEELAEYIRQHEANMIPQGYPHPQVPTGYIPSGAYQQPPGGYPVPQHPQAPQGGYQQAPGGYPQGGYQHIPPGGYQQPPQGGYQHAPAGGYQQAPQGYQQAPQGYQQAPQGSYHHQGPQGGYHPQQGQAPQNPPQAYHDLNTNEIYPHPGQEQYHNQQPNIPQQQQPLPVPNQQPLPVPNQQLPQVKTQQEQNIANSQPEQKKQDSPPLQPNQHSPQQNPIEQQQQPLGNQQQGKINPPPPPSNQHQNVQPQVQQVN